MNDALPYGLLADLVLSAHFTLVLFVVGGLPLIVAGNLAGWRWVNRFGFRLAHLATIAIVAAEAWLGVTCPLTTLEGWLREQAGQSGPGPGFIEYWLQRLLFFEAPPWVFICAYTLFGLLVAATWWRFPPQRTPQPPRSEQNR